MNLIHWCILLVLLQIYENIFHSYIYIYNIFIYSFIHSFVCSFVCLFLCLSIYSLIHCLRFAAMCVQGLWCGIYLCLFTFCFQIHIPLLQDYWCSCCIGVPNITKYRMWTETKHSFEYSASLSLIAFTFVSVISNVQTAVCLSDWLARRNTGTICSLLRVETSVAVSTISKH